jgi:hypothetical protein
MRLSISVTDCRPLLESLTQADVSVVLFMNELKNLTNVAIGKLGKLVHKQSCSYAFFLFYELHFMMYYMIIVQVRYITIETKEVVRIGYKVLLFQDSYSGEGLTFVLLLLFQ